MTERLLERPPLVELQFRIYDRTVICHALYSPTLTIRECKQMLVKQWPEDREISPRSVYDLELIFKGKILKNRKTVAQSGIINAEINVMLKTGMGTCPSVLHCFSCKKCLNPL